MSVEHRAQPGREGIPLTLSARAGEEAVALVVADGADDAQLAQEREAKPTPAQRVLAALEGAERPLRMRQIREGCRMRTATLVQVLADLVRSGAVVRSEQGWSLQPALPFPSADGPKGSRGSGSGKQGP